MNFHGKAANRLFICKDMKEAADIDKNALLTSLFPFFLPSKEFEASEFKSGVGFTHRAVQNGRLLGFCGFHMPPLSADNAYHLVNTRRLHSL